MKKILCLALILLLFASLFGCSKAIIYPEEVETNQWLKERTKGYSQITPSSRMIFYRDGDVTVRIDTRNNNIPELTVSYERTNTTYTETSLLTATTDTHLFASATHENRVFDPYRNAYTRALQVWQKDENHFRMFFWLYGEYTDFYPIPALLTEKQYTKMVEIVSAYHQQKEAEAYASNGDVINYLGDFLKLYEGTYQSNKATNPKGTLFYQYNGTKSEYLTIYGSLFAQLGLTAQDWRKSFEDLGYAEQKTLLNLIYCDVAIENGEVFLTLNVKDSYRTENVPSLSYSFCPVLKNSPVKVDSVP